MALLNKKPAEEAQAPVADAPVAAEAAPVQQKAKKEKKAKVQYLEPNQMNFITQYELVVEGKKSNVDLNKILKPLIAVAAVVLIAFVLLEVLLLGMKAKTKSLEKYINNPDNVAAYNEATAVKEETDRVNTQKANIESCIKAIDSYPNVGSKFFQSIANTATKNGVTVESYGYANETGYLTLTCTSKSISPATTGISQFVRDLVKLGLFDSVEYDRFSGTNEGGYSFDVACVCVGDKDVVVEAPAPAEEAPAEEAAE